MTTWQISDGTTVKSSGKTLDVAGRTDFAKALRWDLSAIETGAPPRIDILPPPGGWVPLDPASPYLVDLWLRDLARRHALHVTTEFERRDDDAPKNVRELLALAWEGEEGVVY